jgi:DNA-binding CsgD family transcriptional regulator
MLTDIVASRQPFVLLTGVAGIGKTTLLAQLSDLLLRQGSRVTATRATARGDLLPIRFAPGEHAVRLPDQAGAPFGPVPGARDNPELARRAAAMIAAHNSVLLIDDAQWLDPDSLAVLHALVRAKARCIAAARPSSRLAAVLCGPDVAQFRVAPQDHRAVARMVTDLLAATPEPALTRRVRELSRGLPAAVRDTVEALRCNGSIQVVDRWAYLVRPHTPLTPPADNQLVEAVRELGEDCWTAAKAVSVLAPLGGAMPGLLTEALRVTDAEPMLARLREAGVLHRGRTWRFVVPLVGAALFAALGPFERRQLSAAVVTAVWEKSVVCHDRDYVTDRIADAGALIDTDRAFDELVRRAEEVRDERATRWLAAAAELAREDDQRAKVHLAQTHPDASPAEEQLVIGDRVPPAEDLPLYCRSMLAAACGDAEAAVDLARRSIAHGEPTSAGMIASTVSVLVARGELASARQMLEATPPKHAHLLDIASARLDRAFGDDDSARATLLACAAGGEQIGMDLVWSELVDLALDRGDRAEAERGLSELDGLAPTSRTTMLALLARATVEKDHDAARECERLARDRGQPLELAVVLERLVKHGGASPALLTEVYGLLGGLDALLYRAWARNLMREHGVPVPGRKETVAENESLLAMIAAGGLSNKQLAAALRTSDKSVEGRLSRLFIRTGYRSRIELSTAMVNGELLRTCRRGD